MYETPLEDMRRKGMRFIPQSLAEALDEFEADEVVQSGLGPELAGGVPAREARRSGSATTRRSSRWETDQYLTLF